MDFEVCDQQAKIAEHRASEPTKLASGPYERLMEQSVGVTHSVTDYVRADLACHKLPRLMDIIRHEYLTSIYDMKLWQIRSGDSYPARRLVEMEKFLKEFDEAVKSEFTEGGK